jgi:hypothetical protein
VHDIASSISRLLRIVNVTKGEDRAAAVAAYLRRVSRSFWSNWLGIGSDSAF